MFKANDRIVTKVLLSTWQDDDIECGRGGVIVDLMGGGNTADTIDDTVAVEFDGHKGAWIVWTHEIEKEE